MAAVAVAIGCGMWLERYVLIVPSLWHTDSLPLGWIELGVTAGFFGACGLGCSFFLARFPVIPFVAQAARPVELEVERADENPSKA
jgi:hypothetical protein